MKDSSARPIELDSAMVAHLEEVAKKYKLPDIGKAVRCLINYSREIRTARTRFSTKSAAWTAESWCPGRGLPAPDEAVNLREICSGHLHDDHVAVAAAAA